MDRRVRHRESSTAYGYHWMAQNFRNEVGQNFRNLHIVSAIDCFSHKNGITGISRQADGGGWIWTTDLRVKSRYLTTLWRAFCEVLRAAFSEWPLIIVAVMQILQMNSDNLQTLSIAGKADFGQCSIRAGPGGRADFAGSMFDRGIWGNGCGRPQAGPGLHENV